MKSKHIALFVAPLFVAVTSCGLQTNAADGVSQQVCDAMNSAKGAVASLAGKSDETTVGDVQKRLDEMNAQLETAKSQSTGLSQAIIGNLQSSVGAAKGELASISPDAPISDLPRGFDGNRTKINDTFNDVYSKLKCS